MPRQLQLKDCSCVFMPSKDTTGSPAHFLSKTTACASAGNIVFIIAPIRKLRTSVLTRNLIFISLQDRIRCKTRIFLLPALPLPDITLQQQQQHSLFSQASWGRLEMKPERNKFKVQAH